MGGEKEQVWVPVWSTLWEHVWCTVWEHAVKQRISASALAPRCVSVLTLHKYSASESAPHLESPVHFQRTK